MRMKSITAAAAAGLAAVLLVGVANATYAGKNGRIAIVQRGGGGFQIWTVLPDGSDPQQLTTQGFNATPSFSADGKQIAYLSNRGAGGQYEIWAMNADGTGQRQLTHLGGDAGFPSFSPTGSRIVFAGHTAASRKDDIYVVKVNGSGLTRLTKGAGNNQQPVYSPDARRIAFISDRSGAAQVWVMNADGTQPKQVTTDKVTHFVVDWSPDGRRLVYDDGNPGTPTAIFVSNVDGSGARQLTRGGTRDFGPRWSPDGRQIAFVRVFGYSSTSEQDTFVMNANGTNQHALHKGSKQLVPAWQPLP
jgi:TolB protein